MKKLLVSSILAFNALSVMAETITSDAFKYDSTIKAGTHTVSIVEKNDQKTLVVDGKPAFKIDSFQASLNYAFKIDSEDVVLLSLSEGGNACPAMYKLVLVSNPNITTKEFGTCSDIPKIIVEAHRLTFVFKKMSGKGTETFIYELGQIHPKK